MRNSLNLENVKLKDVKFQVNSKRCNIKLRWRVGILYFSIGNTDLLSFTEDGYIGSWSVYDLCNLKMLYVNK